MPKIYYVSVKNIESPEFAPNQASVRGASGGTNGSSSAMGVVRDSVARDVPT